MPTQSTSLPIDNGATLLLRFTELMGAGNRGAALAYRNALPARQLEAFYRTLRCPWIPDAHCGPRTLVWAISFSTCDTMVLAEMVRDVNLITSVHGCGLHTEFDEFRCVGNITFHNTTAAVRAAVLAWMSGYVHVEGTHYANKDSHSHRAGVRMTGRGRQTIAAMPS
ncbi:MAG: hypothetical protein M1546_23660 [Chloroflexi bacterium]|nr:hypothetical protein [Chloroflexota bacterium]